MIASIRKHYNQNFSNNTYLLFLQEMERYTQHKIPFRIAETPVFIDRDFSHKLRNAGSDIIRFIQGPGFKSATKGAIPTPCHVPGEDNQSLFIALDFAVCKNQLGEYHPQLIEMQGFPSLFAYQNYLAHTFRTYFRIPDALHHLLNGMDYGTYNQYLSQVLLGNHQPQHVILLEIEPDKQPTAIDFIITEKISGIKAVCISSLIREGRQLYYLRDGIKTPIKRIYNRIIFDELLRRTDLTRCYNLTEEVDVEWAGHPNWFFRISKYTMPLIQSAFIPDCYFLDQLNPIPEDLEHYVLKPLFSFSGNGVRFHVEKKDIDAIPSKERNQYILQRKVQYEPCVESPDGLIKCEIRLLYIYNQVNKSYDLVTNLARLSRGEMIGTKYNKDKTWVGGTVGFFEL
ncbi:MAG: hypothetical protein ACK5FC_10565 [Bacteroidota bacterium]|jgi:hypothetical protein